MLFTTNTCTFSFLWSKILTLGNIPGSNSLSPLMSVRQCGLIYCEVRYLRSEIFLEVTVWVPWCLWGNVVWASCEVRYLRSEIFLEVTVWVPWCLWGNVVWASCEVRLLTLGNIPGSNSLSPLTSVRQCGLNYCEVRYLRSEIFLEVTVWVPWCLWGNVVWASCEVRLLTLGNIPGSNSFESPDVCEAMWSDLLWSKILTLGNIPGSNSLSSLTSVRQCGLIYCEVRYLRSEIFLEVTVWVPWRLWGNVVQVYSMSNYVHH